MKARQLPNRDQQGDVFRVELSRIIDLRHGLIRLSNAVDGDRVNETFVPPYGPDHGQAGVSTPLMVSLHDLTYPRTFTDEHIVFTWGENPYWQCLNGMKLFEHEPPFDPSSMSRWRGRIGEVGDIDVHMDKGRRQRTAKNLCRWMKGMAASESDIGHSKQKHQMDRNRLKGTLDDRLNAILRAAGINCSKLLQGAAAFLCQTYIRLLFFKGHQLLRPRTLPITIGCADGFLKV